MATRIQKGSAAAALAIAIVGGFEGLSLTAYPDVIGKMTVCYGETLNVRRGQVFTKPECDRMFLSSLQDHEKGMRDCLENPDAIPLKTYVSFLSMDYNIGTGGFCNSSIAAAANAGNFRVACERFSHFRRAGGRIIRGLVLRRKDEQMLCLEGVNGK